MAPFCIHFLPNNEKVAFSVGVDEYTMVEATGAYERYKNSQKDIFIVPQANKGIGCIVGVYDHHIYFGAL